RAIIHDDDFFRNAHGVHASDDFGDGRLFVVDRDDDRQLHTAPLILCLSLASSDRKSGATRRDSSCVIFTAPFSVAPSSIKRAGVTISPCTRPVLWISILVFALRSPFTVP